MTDLLIFKGLEDPALLSRIEAFRLDVWSQLVERETATARFALDRFDLDGWHAVSLSKAQIAGCGRLSPVDNAGALPDLCSFQPYTACMQYPLAVLNRLVVHPAHRGNGLARKLTLARIELARARALCEVWVEIDSPRVGAMQRLGFQDMGPSQDASIKGRWRILRKAG